jgi:hypothetical protein
VRNLSSELHITEQATTQLLSSYEKGFNYASIEQGSKILKNLKDVTGGNIDAMKEYLGVLTNTADQFPELEAAMTNMTEADKKRLEISNRFLVANGQRSIAEGKAMTEYLNGSKQKSAADQASRKEMESQVDAVNNLQREFEKLTKIMGESLMPFIKGLDSVMKRLDSFLPKLAEIAKWAFIFQSLGAIGKAGNVMGRIGRGGGLLGMAGLGGGGGSAAAAASTGSAAVPFTIGTAPMAVAGGAGMQFVTPPGGGASGGGASGGGASGGGTSVRSVGAGGIGVRGGFQSLEAGLAGSYFGGQAYDRLSGYDSDNKNNLGHQFGRAGTQIGSGALAGAATGMMVAGPAGAAAGAALGAIAASVQVIAGHVQDIWRLDSERANSNSTVSAGFSRLSETADAEQTKVLGDKTSTPHQRVYAVKTAQLRQDQEEREKLLNSVGSNTQGVMLGSKKGTSTSLLERFMGGSVDTVAVAKYKALEAKIKEETGARVRDPNTGNVTESKSRYQEIANKALEQNTAKAKAEEHKNNIKELNDQDNTANRMREQLMALDSENEKWQAQSHLVNATVEKISMVGVKHGDIEELMKKTEDASNSLNATYAARAQYIDAEQKDILESKKALTEEVEISKKALASKGINVGSMSREEVVGKIADEGNPEQRKELLAHYQTVRREKEGMSILDNKMQAKNIERSALQNEKLKDEIKLRESLSHAYDGQIALAQQSIQTAELEVQLAETIGTGLSASVEMRMRAVQAMDAEKKLIEDQINLDQKQYEQAKQNNNQEDIVHFETEIMKKKNESLQITMKQAQMTKAIRDGYVGAITAMVAGTGMFAKLMVDQTKNLGTGVKYMGVLQSMTSGGSGAGDKASGLLKSSQFTTGGMVGPSEGDRRAQAIDTYNGAGKYSDDVRARTDAARTQMEESIKRQKNEGVGFGANALGASAELQKRIGSPSTSADVMKGKTPTTQQSKSNGGGSVNVGGVTINVDNKISARQMMDEIHAKLEKELFPKILSAVASDGQLTSTNQLA